MGGVRRRNYFRPITPSSSDYVMVNQSEQGQTEFVRSEYMSTGARCGFRLSIDVPDRELLALGVINASHLWGHGNLILNLHSLKSGFEQYILKCPRREFFAKSSCSKYWLSEMIQKPNRWKYQLGDKYSVIYKINRHPCLNSFPVGFLVDVKLAQQKLIVTPPIGTTNAVSKVERYQNCAATCLDE